MGSEKALCSSRIFVVHGDLYDRPMLVLEWQVYYDGPKSRRSYFRERGARSVNGGYGGIAPDVGCKGSGSEQRTQPENEGEHAEDRGKF